MAEGETKQWKGQNRDPKNRQTCPIDWYFFYLGTKPTERGKIVFSIDVNGKIR